MTQLRVTFALLIIFALLNVHLVPHSHDDVGWLKTVDQYYYGSNRTIDNGGVQYILDSVIESLFEDSSRRFVYVEQAFFQRWWHEQTSTMQADVRTLVASGQLEFLNGGWCMHDEATTHYIDMIDQTTLGHKFLLDQFGVQPKVGWQIDPFGHSATQAALLSYEVGFESLFFKRVDYQDLAHRQATNTTEFIWQASPSAGAENGIFTGLMYWGYNSPDGFCFDERGHDEPIKDDPTLEGYNLDARVDQYVSEALEQAATIQGTELMVMAGDDFNYGNARMFFKNLDKLMKAVNEDGRLNMFYSTPSIYTEAKNKQQNELGIKYPTKQDDFFPYGSSPHAYWSGFYTSRPSLKRMVRDLSGELQSLQQIAFEAELSEDGLDQFRKALAVAQHHDAISGTSKQHVAFDYARRLAAGQAVAESAAATAFEQLLSVSSDAPSMPFTSCPLLNVSECSVTQSGEGDVAIVFWNPLFRSRTERITLPLPSSTCESLDASVLDGENLTEVASVIVAADLDNAARTSNSAPCSIVFLVDLPPASATTYILVRNDTYMRTNGRKWAEMDDEFINDAVGRREADVNAAADDDDDDDLDSDQFSISNDLCTLTFSNATGLLTSVQMVGSDAMSLSQDFFYYASSQHATDTDDPPEQQNSGAYIFRPNATVTLTRVRDSDQTEVELVSVTRTPLVQEVVQRFASWLTQTVRLTSGTGDSDAAIEFEWTVGPIPIEDGVGKEVITRYTSDIESASAWSTDANGREMQRRVRFFRPTFKLNVTEPVAGEYYPVNTMASIADDNTQMTVLVDRSQGVTSLEDGELEFMVHRRLLGDDDKGVGEPLNETANISPYPNPVRSGPALVITGTHRVILTKTSEASRAYRSLASRVYAPPFTMFQPIPTDLTPSERSKYFASGTEPITEVDLPVNVDVISVVRDAVTQTTLVRVAHQFAVDEDPELAQVVSIDLAQLFRGGLEPTGIVEMSLTANRKLADMPTRMQWNTDEGGREPLSVSSSTYEPINGTVVQLSPMQIRTFNITFG